jgi:serine/threonine-protein kinase
MYLKRGHRLHNDKYHLLSVLGEGGFSLTYRGSWKTEVQGNLGKMPTFVPVCIKEYFFKDFCLRNPQTHYVETNSETGKEIFDKNKEKIIQEARILSEINHPNVVNVLEVFKQNNTVYIVMEFISGHSIKQEVEQNGVFTEEKLIKIIYKIGQALDYIHGKNILHLDIKPSNILIDKNNRPKLIDFGISKKYDLFNDQETCTMLLAASKGYASIEQYDSEGMHLFSPRPDIYSLGATMYYMITGQVPTESILRSTKGLQNPRELNPSLSENIEKVILKAMALNASDRYESVMDLLLDLNFNPESDKIDSETITELPEYRESEKKINDRIYDADKDDETLIYSNTARINSLKKKQTWIYFISALLIIALFAFFIYDNFGEKLQDNKSSLNNKPSVNQIDIDTVANVYPLPQDTGAQVNTDRSIVQQPANEVKEQTIESVDNTQQENYRKVFSEALSAYHQKKFNEALKLFKQAEFYMKNIDTEQYISLSEQELEKIEIQNRKNLYDDLMDFGNFVVVKKKTDDRFGAIDNEGHEIIPCKYLSTDLSLSGDNRLFQRDDKLYDLYAPSGQLLKQGTNGFD